MHTRRRNTTHEEHPAGAGLTWLSTYLSIYIYIWGHPRLAGRGVPCCYGRPDAQETQETQGEQVHTNRPGIKDNAYSADWL